MAVFASLLDKRWKNLRAKMPARAHEDFVVQRLGCDGLQGSADIFGKQCLCINLARVDKKLRNVRPDMSANVPLATAEVTKLFSVFQMGVFGAK
jgi:hypothetical protein